MARKTIVTLEDDLDGGEAFETLNFAFEGKNYAIDLNDKNAAKFRKAIAPFVNAARREGSIARANGRPSQSRSDVSKIRAWAKQNGYAVSERGRVAREIREAYNRA